MLTILEEGIRNARYVRMKERSRRLWCENHHQHEEGGVRVVNLSELLRGVVQDEPEVEAPSTLN